MCLGFPKSNSAALDLTEFFFHLLFIMLGMWGAEACLCHGTCVVRHVDRATHVRTTFKSHFFPSTMRISGKKLKSLGFAASVLPCCPTLLASWWILKLWFHN